MEPALPGPVRVSAGLRVCRPAGRGADPHNAQRGWCGPGDVAEQVRKRVAYMRAGSAHTSERRRSDGRVIELRGQPLPDGGFVTAFSDVTSHKRTEESLREINETLELRVEERTRQLAAAVSQAELANQSKTRFVMAASHDLLQPLGAARLFNAALRSRAASDGDLRGLAERVDNSLAAAGELLEDLLDISRLDAGGVRAEMTEFDVMDLLKSLQEQFAPVAAQRGISLVIAPTACAYARIIVCFAASCRISSPTRCATRPAAVCCSARGGARPEPWSSCRSSTRGRASRRRTGARFSKSSARLDQPSPWGEKGLGLGLSICERIAAILETTLTLRSEPGRGSTFSIHVPRAGGPPQNAPTDAAPLNSVTARRSRNARTCCASTTTRRRSRDCASCSPAGISMWWWPRVPKRRRRSRMRGRSTSCSRISICRSGPPVSICCSAWCCRRAKGRCVPARC